MAGISEKIKETLDRIQARIAANINAKGLKASGKTEQSMHVVMGESGGQLLGRQYFQSLELGRPAGPVPRNFNAIIQQWIVAKGLTVRTLEYKRKPSERWQPKYSVEERSLRAAARAIAHSIAARGTVLYREGGRRDIYTPVIEEEVKRLETEIVGLVVESIKNKL